MSIFNLNYGWDTFDFSLTDVSLINNINLCQFDKEYDGWMPRELYHDCSVLATEKEKQEHYLKFESEANLRYKRPKRTLNAIAQPSSGIDSVYIGVPEDKEHDGMRPEIENITFQVRECDEDEFERLSKAGRIWVSDSDSKVYASFYAPPRFFDYLEAKMKSTNINFEARLLVKSWNFCGPISDSAIYLDPNEKTRVELASVSVTRRINGPK